MIGTRGRRWLLAHLVLCGAATVGVEVAAFRLLAPSFGATQFITTNVLGVVLACLALGYWLGGRLADRAPRADALYAASALGGAALAALPFAAEPVLAAARPALGSRDASLFLGTLAAMAALFALPLFLLGIVSPFAIRLLARGDERAGSRGGLVFALSTLGSLAGAYLPSLVTIPWVGTRATIQLFGGVVLASAAAGLLLERRRAASALALALAALPAAAIAYPLRPAAAPGAVEQVETEYQLARVARRAEPPCTVLEVNEGLTFHSVWYDDGRIAPGYWGRLHALPLLIPKDPARARAEARICVVGLGAGTVATQWQRRFAGEMDLSIDGVEVDGALVGLARRHFSLDERFLRVHVEDGRTFLARAAGPYDLIVVDAYRQPYVPAHLATREFFALARARLAPGGILALNVGSPGESPVLGGIQNALLAAFAGESVERFEVRNTDVPFTNYILLASREPLRARWSRIDRDEVRPQVASALATWRALAPDPSAPLYTDDRVPVEWHTDLVLLREALGLR